jgi:hypothetical protein
MKLTHTRRDFIRLLGAASLAGALPGSTRVLAQQLTGGTPLQLDSSWQIVLSTKPSKMENLAALDLQHYVEKMTGWKWPIINAGAAPDKSIILGRHPQSQEIAEKLDKNYGKIPDAFVRFAKGNLINIVGTSETAMAFAVWSWLEDLGVRWFFPTEKGEYVPQIKNITMEAGEHFAAPAIQYRQIWPWATGEQKTSEYFGAVENGVTDWNLQQFRLKVWTETNPLSVKGRFINLGWGHSYAYFLPAAKYFSAHPEWFNLIGGKRRTDQLCFTNAEGAHQFAENIRIALANSAGGDPRRRVVWVGPNDGRAWCECPNCQKLVDKDGSATSMVFNFVNLVAKDLQKDHPEVNLQCYAYSNYSTPPDHIQLEPVVTPILTYWVANESFAFNNAKPALSSGNPKFFKAYQKWQEMSRQFGVYQYYGHYEWFLPWPMATQMNHDLKVLSANPKFWGFSCEYHSNWATQGVGMYQLAKLAWDPSLDMEKLMRDYAQKCHGVAAEAMYDYYNTLQEAMDNTPFVIGDFWEYPNIFKPNVIADCDRLIAEAEALLPQMDVGTRWRTELVCRGWRMSSAYAQAAARYVQGGNLSDMQFMRAKMTEANAVLNSKWGPLMADSTISLPRAKKQIARFLVPLEELPSGKSTFTENMNKGGLTKFYSKINNLAPYDWGWFVKQQSSGSLTLPIKAAAGHQIKSLNIKWGTQGANSNLHYEMQVITSQGKSTFKDSDAIGKEIKLPANLFPAQEVTIEMKVRNTSDKGTLSLYSLALEADVL